MFCWFQGKGSYEDRVEMLRLIVDLVEASQYADTPEWRPDISELERKLSEYSKKLSNLQQMVQDLASKTIQSIWLSHVAMQFLGNLRSVRDSYAAMSIGSLPTTEDPSSITKIVLDCESALTFLNRSLSVLSTSVAREQEKAP
ncbi:hypothetical protein B296_00000247 [Ensete ventricosum]|uniref:Uncharacterized protein n=1 Tax=Ensete ventricosum TaxID=4639 RepID=A0A427B3B6_ENSVE|nr:hypothetical protein B296_00000247 [Ensete ventricosum]